MNPISIQINYKPNIIAAEKCLVSPRPVMM